MTPRILLTAMMVASALGACGGQARTPRTTPAATEPGDSLLAILGPPGAHRTSEQLAPVAAFIRRWEQDPLAAQPENHTDHTTTLLVTAWLAESPDVSVVVCMGVPVMSTDRGADVGSIVTPGAIFGMAAYLIEHPGVSPVSAEVQVGGVASSLRWYAASLRRGGAHNAFYDELLGVHASGGDAALLAWYTPRIHCER